MGRRKWIVLGLIIASAAAFFFFSKSVSSGMTGGQKEIANSYIGDEQCKTCHYKQWNDWKVSDHYKAMLPASDSTVNGNFNNTAYSADGMTWRFFKKANAFYINTQGPDGKNHDYKIAYTFGHYPLQQYLIEFPGGRLQATRVSWDSKTNRWFHQYQGQTIAANDWLHWTKDAQNWNTMCARCHSTNLQKNYDFESDTYQTTYSVINVSCESCHGAGKRHVNYVNSADYKNGHEVNGSYLLAGLAHQKMQLNTCATCHMRGAEIVNTSEMTAEIMDHFIPEIPSSEFFYADGQVKDEDYTYTSFLQSKMYSRGVMCSNCHNSHSGKILYAGNQLCLQCHSKKYDVVTHTFHAASTEAAQCVSCHMPGSYFMGNDLRHDHAFRVPRPDLSERYGMPNACNKCHTNQSASWAASAVRKWYGPTRAYHFSEDLILASREGKNSEAHVVRLVNDTATPAIVKATALFYLKNITTQTALQVLLDGLSDSDAHVRYQAVRSLQNFAPNNWINDVAPLLRDEVRAVRIAAADLMVTVPIQHFPTQYSGALVIAKNELENYVLYQTDFSTGNVLAGDYYLKQYDYFNAEKFYMRALKKDSLLNNARLNLSAVYDAQGKTGNALRALKAAAAISPANDRTYYNLGLLYVEMRDTSAAIKAFERGMELKSDNPRLYYNYGLLLFFKNQNRKAKVVLQRGLSFGPDDADIKNAIQFIGQNR